MRRAFIETLESLCSRNKDIFLLSADLGFKLFDRFRKNYPRQFINVGIAETNMIGIAAGLCLAGKTVYCYSMIPFLILRCFEHIKIDVCYHNLNVRLVGVGEGFAYGLEGVTHHALEDIAATRALPNMTVVSPADPLETRALLTASASFRGPLYFRLARTHEPMIYHSLPNCQIGRGQTVLDEGTDACIIATGSMLYNAYQAAAILSARGIRIRLISMHTLKPLDEVLLRECAHSFNVVVTVEEHSCIGGLGSGAADSFMRFGYRGAFKKIAAPDGFSPHIGKREYIREKLGLTPRAIALDVESMVKEESRCSGKSAT